MDYLHSLQQAAEFAGRALSLMALNGIAPHPHNFTVWYCHCSGEWPDLSKTLNILLQTGQPLTEERNTALYKSFCASPYDALPLHLIADRIETELALVLGCLEQAGRGTLAYRETLETASSEIGQVEQPPAVYQILGHLLSETRALASQSREVERQLKASALEIGNLKAELDGARREAMSDALTGLANRRMFESVLRQAAIDAAEAGTPLSMLLLDIDHFKKFNDDFGHVIGDHVLKLLALVLRDNVKGQDTAARFGGEEFAVVLPRTNACGARKVADSIRQIIASKKLVNRKTGEQLSKVSVSIGVAEFMYGEPLPQFIERTDRALYFAKRMGRNRVIVDQDIRVGTPAVG